MTLRRREFLASAPASVAAAAALAGPTAGSQPARPSTQPATRPRDVAWLDEVQRPPAQAPPPAEKLPPLLVDAKGRAITDLAAWRARRQEIRQTWLEFLGTLGGPGPKAAIRVVKEDRPDRCLRQLVRYQAEEGIEVEGYLLRPARFRGRAPGVVVLHSTVNHTIRQPAGVEGKPEKAFGLTLARQGCVTFCPKCFLWVGPGSYQDKVARFQKRHPRAKGMAKMLWDAMRAVDTLAGLDEVDPARLGAVGHSLGAKEVLYLAALDERIRVAVSSEGGVGMRFSNWDAPWYLGPGIRREGFPRRHHELLALAAPRAFLLLGGESADGARSWPYVAAAMPVYRLFGPRPRLGLYNHRRGHSVPPEAVKRIHEWFGAYL